MNPNAVLLKQAYAAGSGVFVFGSNLAGQHGAGAAATAEDRYGAVRGQGVGYHGQSYAIPTKTATIRTMSLMVIRPYVLDFLKFAEMNPILLFQVTQIGCGLAGYEARHIAPMFHQEKPLDNVFYDTDWAPFLPEGTSFWGNVR